ncbi:MAG TPA: DUF1517 domain-containing protein [Kofleriaceae bacterium]|nr:DUF1517 domain-containing protein [Kofleriaceae bacterium]
MLKILLLALALETGGSMGGGDFSESTSSSGGSYSSHDSSYDSGDSYSYHSSSSSTGDAGADLIIAIVGLAISLVFAAIKKSSSLPSYTPDYATPDTSMSYGNVADITVLRVAIDARARKLVQTELARIAQVADTKTAEGRATMLREVALMMRRLRDSWVYGGAHNFPMMSLAEAKQSFQRMTDDARGRFKTETIRNEQGMTTRADAPELHPTSDDGPGVMVVSVIVAARHELFTVNRIGDGEDLRKAFESLSSMIAGELVAVEVVWMPSAEDDRISSIALEAAYPKPDLIPIPGALVGKVFCEYCGAPYPAEAIACPNCGGRAKGAAA